MCTYIKKFSARRYLALTASVKFRKSSPKTARNEQVCAHQKSYRHPAGMHCPSWDDAFVSSSELFLDYFYE